jgi:protein-disulfide isomerase
VNKLFQLTALALTLLCAMLVSAQQPAPTAKSGSAAPPSSPASQKTIEDFLRRFFALGPDMKITVGTPKELGTSGLFETPIEVKTPDGTENVTMYLTKDGRYLIRGEISDLTTDPLAETSAKIQTAGAPVLGDPKAPITLVEYSDFECPVCRGLHDVLRGMLPNYPQVKVIFKDFPLETLHPWARTAALAGRCTYQQNPKAFWQLYDLIYDNQDLISAANVWPQAAGEVDASIANGNLLEVRSTPTVFVNGRRVVGADPHAIQQYLDYEVADLKSGKSAQKK